MNSHLESSCHFMAKIGAGTMGEVWKVRVIRQDQQFIKFAALKISYNSSESQQVAGELNGLRLAISLDLPGIIEIFGIDMLFGRLGVLMKLAEYTLWQWATSRGQTAIFDLVNYIKDVSQTLDILAARGIVHGGITPDEILLCGEQACLIDFSLMHQVNQLFSWPTGVNLLTWACMSPEMKSRTPTLQSDQYSLAASYVALRRLRLPFLNPTADSPLLLDDLTVREQEVIRQAMSRNPGDRFGSCMAFASALEHAVHS